MKNNHHYPPFRAGVSLRTSPRPLSASKRYLKTGVGKRILKGVSERFLVIAFRVALAAAGLKVLLVDGVWNMPVWG